MPSKAKDAEMEYVVRFKYEGEREGVVRMREYDKDRIARLQGYAIRAAYTYKPLEYFIVESA